MFLLSLIALLVQMIGAYVVTPGVVGLWSRGAGDAGGAAGDRAVPAVVREQGAGAQLAILSFAR